MGHNIKYYVKKVREKARGMRTAYRVLFIVGFAAIATTTIFAANAASAQMAFEAESGSVSSPATQVIDVNASGGKAVRFGSVANLNQTITPTLVSDTIDVLNPARGVHLWRNQSTNIIPQPTPPFPFDGYERYYWTDFETSQGTYSFTKLTTAIDNFTNPAKNGGVTGRRFSFRIRAMSDGTDGALRVPQYMQDQGCVTLYATKNVYVPNWDGTCFKDRMDALLAAASTALQPYKSKINWVDIGMYGQWGEWSLYQYPAQYLASSATLNYIIDKHVQYFGWAHLVLFVIAQDTQVNYAMGLQPGTTPGLVYPIGARADCYDCVGFLGAHDKLGTGRPAAFLSRWKTAPFVAERGTTNTTGQTALDSVNNYHITNISNAIAAANANDPAQLAIYKQAALAAGYRLKISKAQLDGTAAAPQITIDWLNSGSAPPYEAWNVEVSIESNGVVKASHISPLPYASLLPAQTYTQHFNFAPSVVLGPGTYTIKVKVKDPNGYLQNMQLPLAGGDSTSGYVIGSFEI